MDCECDVMMIQVCLWCHDVSGVFVVSWCFKCVCFVMRCVWCHDVLGVFVMTCSRCVMMSWCFKYVCDVIMFRYVYGVSGVFVMSWCFRCVCNAARTGDQPEWLSSLQTVSHKHIYIILIKGHACLVNITLWEMPNGRRKPIIQTCCHLFSSPKNTLTFLKSEMSLLAFIFSPFPSEGLPWYNRTGWLGAKHQVTYFFLLRVCPDMTTLVDWV